MKEGKDMNINCTLIAAVDRNGTIGKEGKLPWRVRSEMEYFLKRVAFSPIIMGKQTCLSLKKPINTGMNIVVTTDKEFKRDGFIAAQSLEDAFAILNGRHVYVAGGSSIYSQLLDIYEKDKTIKMTVELSHIDTEVEGGDTFIDLERIKSLFENVKVIESCRCTGQLSWTSKSYS